MKIEITKKPNSPSFPYAVGDIVTVSEKEGNRYIRLSIAKEVKLADGGIVEPEKVLVGDTFGETIMPIDDKPSKKKKAVKGEADAED